MSIEGLISTSALFHDKDGTTTLKVVNLSSVEGYTDGKVAIVTGTCNTAGSTISTAPSIYKDASGGTVSFSTVTRIALAGSPAAIASYGSDYAIRSNEERVASTEVAGAGSLVVKSTAGSATYQLVIYGT